MKTCVFLIESGRSLREGGTWGDQKFLYFQVSARGFHWHYKLTALMLTNWRILQLAFA